MMLDNNKSTFEFSQSVKIPTRSLQRYRKTYLEGKMLHETGGRPRSLNRDYRRELEEFNSTLTNGVPPNWAQIVAKIHELYEKTWRSRFRNEVGSEESAKKPGRLSRRTIYRFLKMPGRMTDGLYF